MTTLSPAAAHISGSAPETRAQNQLQVSGDLACGTIDP
jgi:hypothetical protein